MGMIEQRMGIPTLSPEEKQSLEVMLQNVTEEYNALRAIPTRSEQQPPMGYHPNLQGSSIPVYANPPGVSSGGVAGVSSEDVTGVSSEGVTGVFSEDVTGVSSTGVTGLSSELTSVPASQASFPELPKLENKSLAQEVPTAERNFVNDIKQSWNTGMNNVKEYMKDPHVGVRRWYDA